MSVVCCWPCAAVDGHTQALLAENGQQEAWRERLVSPSWDAGNYLKYYKNEVTKFFGPGGNMKQETAAVWVVLT